MLRRRLRLVTLLFFCGLSIFVMVRAAPQNRTLVLTGHPGELPVLETGGRSYVDIEALTRLANGTLSFRGNQIVLTLPTGGASAPPTNPEILLRLCAKGSYAIRQGHPVTEDWVGTFRAQAQQNLRLVSLAASTDSDRNALQLLNNEFNNMKKLSDRFVEATKSRTYVSPNALESDPLGQKILNCAHSLAAMASNNQFVDDGSCH